MVSVRSPSDLGSAIRAERRALGWSQARLATELGVSRQWVVELERGKARAEVGLVMRAVRAVGLELSVGPARLPDGAVDLDALIERHRGGGD